MFALATAAFSFGRDNRLRQEISDFLEGRWLRIHELKSNPDQNRTVLACSGDMDVLYSPLLSVCELVLDRVDLRRHSGNYPRLGAIDSIFFTPIFGATDAIEEIARAIGENLAEEHGVSIVFTDRIQTRSRDAEILAWRTGGLGSILDRELPLDLGPKTVNPSIGLTQIGVGQAVLTLLHEFGSTDLAKLQLIANQMESLKEDGDPRFLGVSVTATYAVDWNSSAMALEFSLPLVASPDPVLEWIYCAALDSNISPRHATVMGGILEAYCAGAERVRYRPEQVVTTP